MEPANKLLNFGFQKLALSASGANALGLGSMGMGVGGMFPGMGGGLVPNMAGGVGAMPSTEVPTKVVCLSQVCLPYCFPGTFCRGFSCS